MTMAKFNLVDSINTICWFGLLIIVVLLSFHHELFPHRNWWWLYTSIFGFLAISCLLGAVGGKLNFVALKSAEWTLLMLALSLLWVFASLVLPIENAALQAIRLADGKLIDTPNWFHGVQVWSFVPHKSLILLLSDLGIVAFMLLTILLISSRKRLLQFLIVIACIGCFHAIAGIWAKYADVLLVNKTQLDGHYSAARAWFINRNHFAAFLSLATVGILPFIFKHCFLDLQQANGIRKIQFDLKIIFQTLCLSLILIALMLSESRAGFLAIFFGGLIGIISAIGKLQLTKHIVFVVALVFISILFILITLGDPLLSRFNLTSGILGERIVQWRLSWQLIEEQFLFGYGANSYADVFQLFRGNEGLREVVYNQAHNDFLHIWFEQGLIGLLIYILFLLTVLKRALTLLKNSSDALILATTFACLLTISASLIHSIVGFHLQILNIRFFFFTTIAIILVLPSLSKHSLQNQIHS